MKITSQLSLFSETNEQQEKITAVMDKLKDKFGESELFAHEKDIMVKVVVNLINQNN